MGATNLSKIVSAKTYETAVAKLKKEDERDYKWIVRNDEDRYEDMGYEGTWISKIHYYNHGFRYYSSEYDRTQKNLTKRQIQKLEDDMLDSTDKWGKVLVSQISATKFLAVCWTPD